MTDRYARIREALAMGPTPGSREVFDLGMWDVEVRSSSTSGTICQVNNEGTLFRASEDGADRAGRSQGRLLSDAFFIAACDPDTIRALLAERDELAEDRARLDFLAKNADHLVTDDDGRWAVSDMSFQPVPIGGPFADTVGITAIVEPNLWKDSIRAAIDAAIQRELGDSRGEL